MMDKIQIDAGRFAEKRANWALKMTVMKIEKSLMSWLRLGIWLIIFGFTAFKLFQGLLEKGTVLMRPEMPRNIGVFLILLGMFLLIVGIRDYKVSEKILLGTLKKLYPTPLSLWTAYVVLLTGLFLLTNIFFGFGDL